MTEPNTDPTSLKATTTVACYRLSDGLFLELEEQFAQGKIMEGIVIDLTENGFNLPLQYLFGFTSYAPKLLSPGGVMVLLSRNSGMVFEMDQEGLSPSVKCFKPADAIFAHWPFLTKLVRTSVPFFEHLYDPASGNSFRTYIVRSVIPVLTESGRTAKQQANKAIPADFILLGIDDYRSISAINNVALRELGLSENETLDLLKGLEANKLIYPIFKRCEFLVDCYSNQRSFRLGRYFVAAGIMSQGELVGLLERQQDLQTGGKKILLGRLALENNYLNERYLTMLLQEQYVFGGHKARAASKEERPEAQFGDSLFGSLGTIDPPGLLQSIASTQKPGLLSVESDKGVLLINFSAGRMVAARLNRLMALNAIMEFLVSWSEGIFLFREDLTNETLSDAAAIKGNMSKILLDAALLQDNVNTVLSGFPKGRGTVFERVWSFENDWKKLQESELKLFDESILHPADAQTLFEMAQLIDGLSTVDDVILQNTHWTNHKSLFALHLLFTNSLIVAKDNAVFAFLRELRSLSTGMTAILGDKGNHDILVASLSLTQERYPAAKSCQARDDGSIFVEMGRLKTEGVSVSAILEALKYLMATYIAYGRRLNKELVDQLLNVSLTD